MNIMISAFLCSLAGIIMSECGYGVDTWQWWVIILSISFNFINGCILESRRNKS